jgi:hypothetical protein
MRYGRGRMGGGVPVRILELEEDGGEDGGDQAVCWGDGAWDENKEAA